MQALHTELQQVTAELHIVKHQPDKLLRRVQLENRQKELEEQITSQTLEQQVAAAEKKEQRRQEQRDLTKREYEKAIAIAKKMDGTLAEFCKLWDELRPHVRAIAANTASKAYTQNEANYEIHIKELFAQGGFGISQHLGGTPPRQPLAKQLEKDREIVLEQS
jgi:hypothetical protein